MPLAKQTVETFWDKVDKKSPKECWIWVGKISNRGYGRVRWDGIYWAAHRLAYKLTFGDFDKEKFICHQCDTPLCCNPQHLFLGDRSLNTLDMYRKKRENNTKKKLTAEQVKEIRRLYIRHSRGAFNTRNFATYYKVTPAVISNIVRQRSYKNVV